MKPYILLFAAAGGLLCPGMVSGQSISATGDVSPFPATSTFWDIKNEFLFVGNEGTGTLTISDGGKVSNGGSAMGYQLGIKGTVMVEGAGSSWTNTGTLDVGSSGEGALTISNGGNVSNTKGTIGSNFHSSGTVTVTGKDSTWTNTGNLFVGLNGTGKLIISSGGKVSNVYGTIGDGLVPNNTVTVTGAGSTWINTSQLYVAYQGSATLTISDGGKVFSSGGSISVNPSALGAVSVTGADSSWINNGSLYVGVSNQGTLMISGGGTVSNTEGSIGSGYGARSTVTVTGAGSTWNNTGSLDIGNSGMGALTISNGGKVTVGDTLSIRSNSTATLDGGTLLTQHLNRTGGTFNFVAGMLIANGTITGDLAVPKSGALGGNAAITGDLLVAGMLAPGNSTGLLTVGGDLTLDDDARITLELASLSDFDRIVVNGGLIFGGTLMLEFLDGFTLDGPTGFTLFTGGYTWLSGAFANIEFSTSGYEGIFDYETGSLTINVIPEPSTYGLLIIASAVLLALRRHRCRRSA